jgi:lysophospholipid acyltransferase (LPLAT)-like uncharacterized protein
LNAEPGLGGLPPPRPLIDAPWFRYLVGVGIIGSYMRLARATSRVIYEPADYLDRAGSLEPAIYLAWHANVLGAPFFIPHLRTTATLSAPHPDGLMGAVIARSFGMSTIIGTGVSGRQSEGTGGVAGFRAMLRALAAGTSLYLNAEIPPTPGRQVGRGIVALARKSGRPIIPVALASSRRTIVERLWDKMQINHPFSHAAVVSAPVTWISAAIPEADALALVKQRLDEAYARAMNLADGGRKP